MTVRAILDSKGRHIHNVNAETKLSDAIKLLGEKRIGAVLVMDKGGIEGILSERDIVRVLGDRGAKVLEELVYRVPEMAIEGRSRQPLIGACRQIKALVGPTKKRAGLFREGSSHPDISCPVESAE